jgi:hypothetical protein
MLESLAAAVATALISTGAAAAVSAARKSGETRDAVLMLQAKVDNLDARVVMALTDLHEQGARLTSLESRAYNVESRVSALEAGVVNRRVFPE